MDKRIFRAKYRKSIMWQYITQAFVHNGWKHFQGNLLCYFLYSFIGLLLANQSKEKKSFLNYFYL